MKVYETIIEIYLDDLKEDVQEEYLRFFETNRHEMNADSFPIIVLEKDND